MKTKKKVSKTAKSAPVTLPTVQPKVSVIIPTLNAEGHLRQSLDSLMFQTMKEIDILVVDRGSTDDTIKIAKMMAQDDNRIKIIQEKKESRLTLKNMQGDYVLYLDPNDYLETNAIERLYKKATLTDGDIVFSNYSEYDQVLMQDVSVNGCIAADKVPGRYIFSADDCSETIFNIIPDVLGCFLYEKAFLGEYPLDFSTIPDTRDITFLLKTVSLAGKIVFLNNPLMHHRIHFEQIDLGKDRDLFKDFKALHLFLQQIGKFEQLRKSFIKKLYDSLWDYRKGLHEPQTGVYDYQIAREVLPYFENWAFDIKGHSICSISEKRNLSAKLYEFVREKSDSIITIIIPARWNSIACNAGVLIQSIIEKATPDYFYDIYLLHIQTTEEYTIKQLEAMTNDHIRVTCINIKDKLPQSFTKKMADLFDCHPFLIPELFPNHKKALYLSPTTIVQKDVADIFNVSIKDNLVAGAMAYGDVNYIERDLGLISESFIRTDVMVMNLDLWRQEALSTRCFDLILVPVRKFKSLVQDIINYVCQDRILVLKPYYNGQWPLILGKKIVGDYPYLPEEFHIINYTDKKPWSNPELELMDIWWLYARRSPFYEEILFKNIEDRVKAQKAVALVKPVASKQIPAKPVELKQTTSAKPAPAQPSIKPVAPGKAIPPVTKQQVLEQKDALYPLISDYVSEKLLSFVTFGDKRKRHIQNLNTIKNEIQKRAKK